MFGKLFASAFTGSMIGAGPEVFAVWAYILANKDQDGFCEINPVLVATAIGMPADAVLKVIEYLCSPDAHSRSQEQEGRRLEKVKPFLYAVVNHKFYDSLRSQQVRRVQNQIAQQRFRDKSRKQNVSTKSADVSKSKQRKPLSAHVDVDVDVDVDSPPPPPRQNRPEGTPSNHRLALIGGGEYIPTLEEIRRWSSLYQAVDVEASLRLMAGWLDANPSRRKTERGIRRFVAAWLGRDQDRGSRSGGAINGTDDFDSKQSEWLDKMRRLTAEKEAELAAKREAQGRDRT